MANAYATVADVEARLTRDLTTDEKAVCSTLLGDAAVYIDAFAPEASAAAKQVVSCNMVIRTLGDGSYGVPTGATQGSMSALGYSQSWTIGSGGSTGEIYFSKLDRKLLGIGNAIGSYSPTQELVPRPHPGEALG
ncbi:MAG: hypothetical protein IKQ10_03785 [Oscillospiraceae bacterium]|nr:hypothetical protein [Oscillospiraceae bacterium]